MNQKIGFIILPAPKQDGSGLEYMIADAELNLIVLIRDMFVIYFQKSSKQHTNKGRLSCICFFSTHSETCSWYIHSLCTQKSSQDLSGTANS